MKRQVHRSAETTRLLAEQRTANRRYATLLDRFGQEGNSLCELTLAREEAERLLDQVGMAMYADVQNEPHKAKRAELTRRLRVRIAFCNEMLGALNKRYQTLFDQQTGKVPDAT